MDHKAQLLKILKSISYEKRNVILASGKPSDFYIDCRQTTLNSLGSLSLGEVFYAKIRELGLVIDGVGGPTLGADPIVTAIGVVSAMKNDPIDGFLIRKEKKGHGTGNLLEGTKSIKPAGTVLIVEDVVTTGTSSLDAVAKVRDAGYTVAGILALVDRLEGGRENIESHGITLTTIFTKKDFA